MRKTILVTGGAGYIGSHVVMQLLKRGYFPVTYDNLSEGDKWAVVGGDLIIGDLADTEKLNETFSKYEIDAIMHFAASAYVGESMRNPRKYFQNNVANTINLLNVASDHHVKHFIFSSSCATYGMPAEIPITEEHPQVPINPYEESKLMVEKILSWYSRVYGLKYVSLRYFNAVGTDPEGELGQVHELEIDLIPRVLRAAQDSRKHAEIYGTDYDTSDGTCMRDYIHVTDLADAHLLALEYLRSGGKSDVFNVGNETGYSVKEVSHVAKKVTQQEIHTKEAARRPGDPSVLIAASGLARRFLGVQPRVGNLLDIIETAWKWLRACCLRNVYRT